MTKLKKMRNSVGIGRKFLAEKSGTSLRMIEKYERGEKEFNKAAAETVYRIAQVLGCKMEDLIDIKEEKKMEKFTKYEVVKTSAEIKKREDIIPGCTHDIDEYPELIKSFESKEEALAELEKYSEEIADMSGYYLVSDYCVEENIYDEDGEFVAGGDVWKFAEYK